MPTAIDEEKFAAQETLDLSKPQGTPHGLPIKQIPHLEYPRVVYMHPRQPFREVVHRNARFEEVGREVVATEHMTHVCADAKEHKRKLAEGWVDEPYMPQAPPDPIEDLYRKPAELKAGV